MLAITEDSLITACNNHEYETAIRLINSGAINFEYVDPDGNTALIAACSSGLYEVAKLILKHISLASLSRTNNKRKSALVAACENNLSDVALEIIKIGYADNESVYVACKSKMHEVALTLLKIGAPIYPTFIGDDGMTPLIWACRNNMTEVVLAIINSGHSLVNHIVAGYTALHYACQFGSQRMIVTLLATGDSKPDKIIDDKTPLIMACMNGNDDTAVAIINTGRSLPMHKHKNHKTALHYACEKGMLKTAMLLIQLGGYDGSGMEYALLRSACESNMIDVVKAMIAATPDKVAPMMNAIKIWRFDDLLAKITVEKIET